MGQVLYEVRASGKMDCLYFQVERTLREQGLSEVLRLGGLLEQVQEGVHPSTCRLTSHKPPRIYGLLPKGRSLDDYIDGFQDLVRDSGYTDPKTIVVEFH